MFDTRTRQAITRLAAKYKFDPAAVMAIAEVESAGVPWWNVNGEQLPAIRIEGHYFWRNLPAGKRTTAANQRLASPKAQAIKNPRSYSERYAKFWKMVRLDSEAAYKSISIGMFQVMGEHASRLGFPSAKAMFDYAKQGIAQQVDIGLRYVMKFGLADELRQRDWAGFAYGYNGPAYKKFAYDKKMARAYARYSGTAVSLSSPTVLAYQKELRKLGYYKGPIDGIKGRKTRQAITRFQMDRGIVADGKYGPMTRDEIAEALMEKRNAQRDWNAKAGGAASAGGTAGTAATEVIKQTTDQVSGLTAFLDSPVLHALLLTLIFGGLVFSLWNLFKKEK
jgi:hypothetical protein